MMRTPLMLAAAALLAAVPARAQQALPVALEVRGRAAFPTGDFGEEDEGAGVSTGWGGSVGAIFQATPVLGIYAGYSFTRFGTDLGELEAQLELLGIDDASVHIDDSGLDAGVRARVPAMGGSAFVRGGLVYHRVEVKISDELQEFFEEFEGEPIDEDALESDWSPGYQLGAGFLLPLGPRLSASFAATYTAFEPRFDDDTTTEVSSDDVTYASVEVGLEFRP